MMENVDMTMGTKDNSDIKAIEHRLRELEARMNRT